MINKSRLDQKFLWIQNQGCIRLLFVVVCPLAWRRSRKPEKTTFLFLMTKDMLNIKLQLFIKTLTPTVLCRSTMSDTCIRHAQMSSEDHRELNQKFPYDLSPFSFKTRSLMEDTGRLMTRWKLVTSYQHTIFHLPTLWTFPPSTTRNFMQKFLLISA